MKGTESKPIEKLYLNNMREELENMFSVRYNSDRCVRLYVRTPFTLGLLIGHIVNRFVRDGIGFDSMTINVKKLCVTLSVPEENEAAKLLTKWE